MVFEVACGGFVRGAVCGYESAGVGGGEEECGGEGEGWVE